jgi:hypothetical protein
VASGLFAESLHLRYLPQSLVIDDLYDGSALFKVLTALCTGRPPLGDDELMEKVSLGNRESNGKTIQFGNIGKVNQDVDER